MSYGIVNYNLSSNELGHGQISNTRELSSDLRKCTTNVYLNFAVGGYILFLFYCYSSKGC